MRRSYDLSELIVEDEQLMRLDTAAKLNDLYALLTQATLHMAGVEPNYIPMVYVRVGYN